MRLAEFPSTDGCSWDWIPGATRSCGRVFATREGLVYQMDNGRTLFRPRGGERRLVALAEGAEVAQAEVGLVTDGGVVLGWGGRLWWFSSLDEARRHSFRLRGQPLRRPEAWDCPQSSAANYPQLCCVCAAVAEEAQHQRMRGAWRLPSLPQAARGVPRG